MSCCVDSEPIPALQINEDRLGSFWPYLYRGNKNSENRVELPLIVWKDSMEDNPYQYLNMIQKIHDSLLLNNSTVFKYSNPNTQECYNRFLGKIEQKDYADQGEFYGSPTSTKIKDNSFYHEVYEKLISKVTATPFVLNIKITSEEYLDEQLDILANKVAGLVRNAAIEELAANGVNVDGISDESVPEPVSEKQLQTFLDGSETYDKILYKLVNHVMNNSEFKDRVIKPAFRESFIVNTEFAHIDTTNDEVMVEAVSCKNIQFLASEDQISSLEDASVLACGVSDYISLQEIIRTYGYKLDAIVGIEKLKQVLNRLQSGDKSVETYNPEMPLFGESLVAEGEFSGAQALGIMDGQNEDITNRRYFNEIFYPRLGLAGAVTCKFLRHRAYFRVLKNKKFKLLINGKNPTPSQVDEFKNRNIDNKLVADFVDVKDDYKKQPGEYIVNIPKEELHSSTRIGHSVFVDFGKYRYSTDYIKNQNKPGFPIVMQSSFDKSFVKIGEPIEKMVNKLSRTVDELIDAAGFSTAIIIDDVQGYDAADTLYSLKKKGIAEYNSTIMNSSGSAGRLHLSSINTGNQLEDIQKNFQMIGLLKLSYEKLCGVFNQSNPYDGLAETQINLDQAESIFGARYQDHNLFITQILQRVADISKIYYAKHKSKAVNLGKGEVQILKKLIGMQNWEYNVFMNNGIDLKNKSAQIDKMMEYISQSGGVEFIDSILEVLWEDNPMKKLDIFRNKKEMLLKAQASQQEAQAQGGQQQAQLEALKVQIPIEKEKLRIQGELLKIQEKAKANREQLDFKGKTGDINEQNTRDRMVLNKQLESAFDKAASVEQPA